MARQLHMHRTEVKPMTSQMKHLVAIDLDELDAPANPLAPAIAMAQRMNATLDLAYIDPMPYVAGFVRDPAVLAMVEKEMEELRKKNRAALLAQVDELPEGIRGDGHYSEGADPVQVLCDLAQAHDIDCIVVGTHGRRGVRRALLGSVAEKTVRLSPVPVLVTRPTDPERALTNKVVLALDLLEAGLEKRVETAARWAAHMGATLDLLYVAPDLQADLDLFTADAARILSAEAERVDLHQIDKLKELAATIPEAMRGKVHRLESRHAADTIADAAADADLLMLHTHGRTGLSHAFFGSVAAQVVRVAKVPTLVFRG
jgi:nucleotide-binding universal stress UspA family protein